MRGRWSKDLLLLYRWAEPHKGKKVVSKSFFLKEKFKVITIIDTTKMEKVKRRVEKGGEKR
jgi:hypothetical protein